jgi:hypothetical protein
VLLPAVCANTLKPTEWQLISVVCAPVTQGKELAWLTLHLLLKRGRLIGRSNAVVTKSGRLYSLVDFLAARQSLSIRSVSCISTACWVQVPDLAADVGCERLRQLDTRAGIVITASTGVQSERHLRLCTQSGCCLINLGQLGSTYKQLGHWWPQKGGTRKVTGELLNTTIPQTPPRATVC